MQLCLYINKNLFSQLIQPENLDTKNGIEINKRKPLLIEDAQISKV